MCCVLPLLSLSRGKDEASADHPGASEERETAPCGTYRCDVDDMVCDVHVVDKCETREEENEAW